MRAFGSIVAVGLLATASEAGGATMSGSSGNFRITWPTRTGFNYIVETSDDLGAWSGTWMIETGTGSVAGYDLPRLQGRGFYRAREYADSFGESFLLLPEQATELCLKAGVCFSFDLGGFDELPGKIRLYKRPFGSGEDWEIIGTITDFAEIDGIKFVRGSAIWLPDAPGQYEVQTAVVSPSGELLATATRLVPVVENAAPTVAIIDGPRSPSPTGQAALFETEVSDPDGEVQRVEFFDNGVLIGTDFEAPFGNLILGPDGETYTLLRGTHNITAMAYDSHGATGESPEAFAVVVTGGNARPELAIISPDDGLTVEQGDDVVITCTVSDADGAADLVQLEAWNVVTLASASNGEAPFDSLTINTANWKPGSHVLRIRARDTEGASSYPRDLHLRVTTPGMPDFAQMLVAEIVDEDTATASAPSFTGVEPSSGLFAGGLDSGLEIDSGAVLTSGAAVLWNGGDVSESSDENLVIGFPNFEEPGDAALDALVDGYRTLDAAVLEFDVFCPESQLEIVYQFGSEEYDNYVGNFNDAFLVTVDGVPSSFVPDCSAIVSVSSVNAVMPANEHLYLDDDIDIAPNVAPGNEGAQVEYDGMTIRLRVHAFVSPNESHRVRLVVGDVNDDLLDSGLFILSNGVRTISPIP